MRHMLELQIITQILLCSVDSEIIEKILTGETKPLRQLSFTEQMTTSTPIYDLLLHLLYDEHDGHQGVVEGLGEKVQDIRLQNSWTERELGDRSVLDINSLELENSQVVFIDDGSVSPTPLGSIVV